MNNNNNLIVQFEGDQSYNDNLNFKKEDRRKALFNEDENYAFINVHRSTRYQNIKDILYFEDLTEIKDYAFNNCNDHILEELDDHIKYIDGLEYEEAIKSLLNFIFDDNYNIKVIYDHDQLGLIEL